MNKLNELRGALPKRLSLILNVLGVFVLVFVWQCICWSGIIDSTLLPTPYSVLLSFYELATKFDLVDNAIYSILINTSGYVIAIVVAIPIGFVVGLNPVVRELFRKQIDALRFLPLTALTGLFIAWFGIFDTMKISFLAFGIFVYLLPVVIQRISEVDDVYIDTVTTLGASKWQTIKSVFIPAVKLKILDDIRVLVAISWTYIIVAELVNKTNGVGAIAYTAARASRVDLVFGILLVIIAIGMIQDQLFLLGDKIVSPSKHKSEK